MNLCTSVSRRADDTLKYGCFLRRLASVDAELLLQARGRRRVLEHETLVRIDVAMRLLRHQRALVEAAENELELARIGIDVADGEDSGNAGLECRGLDRDEIVLKLDAPVRNRA